MRAVTTLEQLITDSAAALDAAGVAYGQGTTCARDEAAWLVLWQLGLPLDTDWLEPDGPGPRPLAAAQVQAAQALVARRIATRQPAAYLTGEAWLQGLPFFVDARSIVPRSLLAELVADPAWCPALDAWLDPAAARVLDLCTGNGSLAVLAALAWPEVHVVATDLSAPALEVAARNVARHRLGARIALRRGDGLAALHPGERFDLVLCNPPYVNAASMAALPPEFRAEPALALDGNADGGRDGMDFVRRLLAGIGARLAPRGVLVLEVGHERAHFEAAFPALAPQAVWLDTSAGDEQVLLLPAAALPGGPGEPA
jgi:ribosomal protein L3 glutamine methyltransferase